MKNNIFKAALVLGVVLAAFSSCKKEQVQQVVDTYEQESAALADQAMADMDNQADPTDDGAGNLAMMNDGIAPDFLVMDTDIDEEEGPAGGIGDRKVIRDHSFAACLRKLNLDTQQRIGVKRALHAYDDCRHTAIKRARAIHAEMQAAYKAKADRLIAAYRAGNISKERFEAAMKELRENFRKELRSKQIQEKLDESLKNCYKVFLGRLKNILNERQWKAFVACHRR